MCTCSPLAGSWRNFWCCDSSCLFYPVLSSQSSPTSLCCTPAGRAVDCESYLLENKIRIKGRKLNFKCFNYEKFKRWQPISTQTKLLWSTYTQILYFTNVNSFINQAWEIFFLKLLYSCTLSLTACSLRYLTYPSAGRRSSGRCPRERGWRQRWRHPRTWCQWPQPQSSWDPAVSSSQDSLSSLGKYVILS